MDARAREYACAPTGCSHSSRRGVRVDCLRGDPGHQPTHDRGGARSGLVVYARDDAEPRRCSVTASDHRSRAPNVVADGGGNDATDSHAGNPARRREQLPAPSMGRCRRVRRGLPRGLVDLWHRGNGRALVAAVGLATHGVRFRAHASRGLPADAAEAPCIEPLPPELTSAPKRDSGGHDFGTLRLDQWQRVRRFVLGSDARHAGRADSEVRLRARAHGCNDV